MSEVPLQPSRGGANRLFNCLDVHHKSLGSRERQCKSRTCKRRFDPTLRAGGSTRSAHLPAQTPLFSEYGTHKTVRAIFWP